MKNIFLIILILIVCVGCKNEKKINIHFEEPCVEYEDSNYDYCFFDDNNVVKYKDYDLNIFGPVDPETIYYMGDTYDELPKDDNGIPIIYINGKKVGKHPARQAVIILSSISQYLITEDEKYLERAKYLVEYQITQGEETENELWFPYDFKFSLHKSQNQLDQLYPPWYSCIAQGEMLSVFIRMYEVTGEYRYYVMANKIFNTYLSLDKPWISIITRQSYLWFEEYPYGFNGEYADYVLNGHMKAVISLWDYWRVTGDEKAKFMLKASLYTLEKYMKMFRVQGSLSMYCLRHKVTSKKYHKLHITELDMIWKLSGDDVFREMRDNFISDVQ